MSTLRHAMMEAQTFWRQVRDVVLGQLRPHLPFIAIVSEVHDNGLISIRRVDQTSPDGEQYARLAGFDVAASDEVIILPIGEKPVVLGRLQRTAPPLLDVPGLRIGGGNFSVTPGAALGSSPPAATQFGHQYNGEVIFTTGASGAGTGIAIEIVFENEIQASGYQVFLQPESANASGIDWWVGTKLSTGFEIRTSTALSNDTGYTLNFLVMPR